MNEEQLERLNEAKLNWAWGERRKSYDTLIGLIEELHPEAKGEEPKQDEDSQ